MSGAYRKADATVSASRAAAVTLSDSAAVECTRGVYVGGAGDLKVTFVEGGEVTFVGVVAGTLLPIQVVVIWSTGSTATSVVALY